MEGKRLTRVITTKLNDENAKEGDVTVRFTEDDSWIDAKEKRTRDIVLQLDKATRYLGNMHR